MRDAFVRVLTNLARNDKDVMLLTADLGFGVLTGFAEEFPDQFLNVGIAEQNMTGLAVGLAMEGKKVFTYSIGNFPTLRCLEQIRNDVCYHKADVKIVCVGGGFSYGPLGISHHATEDLAVMRALPNMTVLAPGDIVESEKATALAYDMFGPCYLRLGRGNEPKIHEGDPSVELGKALMLFCGGEIPLLSTGGILPNVVETHNELQAAGIETSVYSMLSVKPIDYNLICELAQSSKFIVTVEEHSVIGGLGSAVAEILSGLSSRRPPLLRIGLEDIFSYEVGDQDYLREFYGLSPSAIAMRIKQFSKQI